MATTTTTTWTSAILSEALAERAIPANLPKQVVINLVNQDSIDGQATKTKQYPILTDLGASSSLTEGTDIAATVTLGYGTAVTVTPSEHGEMAEITNQAIRRKFPGLGSNAVQALMNSADVGPIVDALAEQAQRLAAMNLEAAEQSCVDLVAGFSNTVGTSGTDLAVSDLIEAIYTYKTLETPGSEDAVFALAPNQIREMQLELNSTSAAGSAIWTQQATASAANANFGTMNGFRGEFLGVPMYEFSHSLRPSVNAGADTAGALMARGVGAPDSGQVGAGVFLEGAPLYFAVEQNVAGRSIKLSCIYEFAAAELSDSYGVSIITDAP